jgi:cell division protein FtsL
MEQPKKQEEAEAKKIKKLSLLQKILLIGLCLLALLVIFFIAAIAYNNLDFWNDTTFAYRLDSAIKNADTWVQNNRGDILELRNAALVMMLGECNDLKENKIFKDITFTFLKTPTRDPSRCLNRMVDPNWPVIEWEFNKTFESAALDYKWIYYAIAPDKAKFNAEKSGLFDGQRWHRRYLTHQLLALTLLKNRQGSNEKTDKVLLELCERTNTDMTFCLPVVDIYIQRAAYVLQAGFPQKVRRRWIERIINQQQSDGGWNDRWFCFTTPRSKFIFNLDETPSDQHATIQAVLALYLVKYRYPELFGLK